MHIPLWLRVQHLPEECFSGENRWVFDFIKQGVSEEDANSVGMSWKNAIAIEPHWTMAHIAHAMGIFPSAGQARKNGWSSPIETGFSERGGIGKRNLCFFIWNPTDVSDEDLVKRLLNQGGVLLDGEQIPGEDFEFQSIEEVNGKLLQFGKDQFILLTDKSELREVEDT